MTNELLFGKLRTAILFLLLSWLIACNSNHGAERYKNSDLNISFQYPNEFDIRKEEGFNKPCSDIIFIGQEDDVHCILVELGRRDQEIWKVTVETFPNASLNFREAHVLDMYLNAIKTEWGEDNVKVLKYDIKDDSNDLNQTNMIIMNIDIINNQPGLGIWVIQSAVKFVEGEKESAIIVAQTLAIRDSDDIDPILQTIVESFQFD